MGHLRPRMVHPHNSGSIARIVLQFYIMKGDKTDINGFSEKKFLFRAIW